MRCKVINNICNNMIVSMLFIVILIFCCAAGIIFKRKRVAFLFYISYMSVYFDNFADVANSLHNQHPACRRLPKNMAGTLIL